MEHKAATEEFREQLRYAAYGTETAHSQDLRGVREWRRELDKIAERMYALAFKDGVQWQQENESVWHFPFKEDR